MAKRFEGLTLEQEQTFTQVMFGLDGPRHPKRMQKLIDKGLVVSRQVSIGRDRFGDLLVTEYAVPMHVNLAYCVWCSENVEVPDVDAAPRTEGET